MGQGVRDQLGPSWSRYGQAGPTWPSWSSFCCTLPSYKAPLTNLDQVGPVLFPTVFRALLMHCNIRQNRFSAMRTSLLPKAALQQTKSCIATLIKLPCKKVALSSCFPADVRLPRLGPAEISSEHWEVVSAATAGSCR